MKTMNNKNVEDHLKKLGCEITISESKQPTPGFGPHHEGDEDDLDDIIIPEIHDNDDWREKLRKASNMGVHKLTPPSNVDWNKKIKGLNEHLTSANAKTTEMRHISEENQEELSRLNKMICDLTRERDDLLIKLKEIENRK